MTASSSNVTLRSGVGRPLTYEELDTNFQELINIIVESQTDVVKHNISAIVDPTVNDDSSQGYEPRSTWFNTATGEIFKCIDATVGAAKWVLISLTLDDLGTASTADLTTSATDTTSGRVLKVGDYGIGGDVSGFKYSSVYAFMNQNTWISGRAKIILPFAANSDAMLRFTIDVYAGYRISTYNVSGYLYTTDNNWFNPRVLFSGVSTTPDIVFGKLPDNRAYVSIAIGDYAGVAVRDVTFGSIAQESYYLNKDWVILDDSTTENIVSPEITTVFNTANTGSILSGNGLTGGGDLTASRTISLGTPGTLSGTSTNSVTSGSHTHAIDSTTARNSTSTSTLLAAAAMNDHIISSDHDARYALNSEVSLLAAYFNMLQRELLNVLADAGLEPDIEDETQLAQAMNAIADRRAMSTVDGVASITVIEE